VRRDAWNAAVVFEDGDTEALAAEHEPDDAQREACSVKRGAECDRSEDPPTLRSGAASEDEREGGERNKNMLKELKGA
jgi:hypothetical protein